MFLRDTALYWNFIKEDLGMKKLHCFLRKNSFLSLFRNIPAKLLSYYFPSAKNVFIGISLYKKKWFINCFFNAYKSNIGKHLDIISRSLDTLSTKYENIVLLGDFNACVDNEALQTFRKSSSWHSLTKQPHTLKISRTLAALI